MRSQFQFRYDPSSQERKVNGGIPGLLLFHVQAKSNQSYCYQDVFFFAPLLTHALKYRKLAELYKTGKTMTKEMWRSEPLHFGWR
ncbi:hypothetical protein VTL71DRAFT_12585 [Oculimacula yallundae]|uniref:Uncharacterized protein n=1 Tax=Oculimacula yallundae TaxID=86028 RepID=A0ABR4CNH8_9HELO